MDLNALKQVLQDSYQADPDRRNRAEQNLANLAEVEGYLPTLLRLVTDNKVDVAIRQAAILALKRQILDRWGLSAGAGTTTVTAGIGGKRSKKNVAPIPESDRKIIKDNLFEAILFQPQTILRVQLLACLFHIVKKEDFPRGWESLMPKIMQNLQSGDTTRVYAALCSLRMIFKKYHYKKVLPGDPILEIMKHTFPVLLKCFNQVINTNTPEAHEIMRIILKIYFMSTHTDMPAYLMQDEVISGWMPLLEAVIVKKVTQDMVPPQNPEQVRNIPLCKSQKWASRILCRLFKRYGRPELITGEDDRSRRKKDFASMWLRNCSGRTLTKMMEVLQNFTTGSFVSERVLYEVYSYLDTAINYSALYKFMKEHLHFVLFDCVFRTLCLTQEDLNLWKDNPAEFVRREHDYLEELSDPRMTASKLLRDLVRIRTRDTLQRLLEAMSKILSEYAKKKAEEREPKHFIRKEGAMRVLGALAPYCLKNPELTKACKGLLLSHILPEFRNPHGFMRARACWMLAQFGNIQLDDHQHHRIVVQAIVHSLRDPELPVKIEAAKAIERIILADEYKRRQGIPMVIGFVRPLIPIILEEFFKLVTELGSEQIVSTFDLLIDRCGDEIAPYATQVAQRLVRVFVELWQNQRDDEEAQGAAMQCMGALNTLLYSCHSMPEIFPRLEQLLQVLINRMLTMDGEEVLEELLDILCAFTYFSETISPFMWSLLPRICHAYHTDWGEIAVNKITAVLDNFISKGTKHFVQQQGPNNNYIQMVYSIPKKIFEDPGRHEAAKYGERLLESLLVNCRDPEKGGAINQLVPHILTLTLKTLSETTDLPVKLLLFNVVSAAAYYNPKLFLSLCAANKWTETLINVWLSHLPHMSWPGKKMSSIGLSSLFLVPVADMPEKLQKGLAAVLTRTANLVIEMNSEDEGQGQDLEKEERQFQEDEQKRAQGIDPEADDGEDLAVGYEDDDLRHQFLDVEENRDFTDPEDLQNYQARETGDWGEDDDDDLRLYVSPIDSIDEVIFFCQCMENLSSREPEFYKQWSAQFPPIRARAIQRYLKAAREARERHEIEKKKREAQEAAKKQERIAQAKQLQEQRQKAQAAAAARAAQAQQGS